ncbi:MAG TPA: M48 family metallopeptidase [Actinomycetota bacterium]|nr:M48 family metallopeptidase [Actinomycetota bacterium]
MKVEIVRSPRRRKTITAEHRGGKVVVRLPAGLTQAEERTWVRKMVNRLTESERLERLNAKMNLERRALELNERYFDGRLRWRSIRWVGNQRYRYGSCTPSDKTIRIASRVAEYPSWVRDYVLMHELAHLRIADHSSRFWEVVRRYPLAERARGYLIAKGLEE